MAIYVDLCLWPAHGRMWCHLMSDGPQEELLAFARQIGLKEKRLQRAGTARAHFDLPDDIREIAILAGALPVSPQEIVRRCVWPKLPAYAGRLVNKSTTEQE